MSHSKDLSTVLDEREQEELVRDVVGAWGRVEAPTLRDAPLAALVALATRSVTTLADTKVLSVDQSVELQGRVQALEVLATTAEVVVVTDALPRTLFEALSSTLPDASLATSWNVLLTALVATAAVLGSTVLDAAGADIAAAEVLVRWPGWLEPAASAA